MKFIYKETGKIFNTRKEAKEYFGSRKYNYLLKNNKF